MKLLIHHDHFDEMVARLEARFTAEPKANLEALAAFEATRPVAAPVTVVDGVARIDVKGPLLDAPDWFFDWIGVEYSDYQTIASQMNEANGSSDVKSIVLSVDSPGGLVRGVFAAADVIHNSEKPVTAVVSGMAASAGYLLASQATNIVATSRADQIGSIGVAVDIFTSNRVVSIASDAAPEKRPDVTTEAGKAIVRKELNDLHGLFRNAIERGREVSGATVDRDFGQGGVLLAADAVRVGMIDSLEEAGAAPATAVAGHHAESGDSVTLMNEETLKREHPELYARVTASASEDGHAKGIEKERARVLGHLELGEAAGCTDVALGEIKSGAALPEALNYHTALLKKAKIDRRDEESTGDRGNEKDDAVDDGMTAVFVAAARNHGVEVDLQKGA